MDGGCCCNVGCNNRRGEWPAMGTPASLLPVAGALGDALCVSLLPALAISHRFAGGSVVGVVTAGRFGIPSKIFFSRKGLSEKATTVTTVTTHPFFYLLQRFFHCNIAINEVSAFGEMAGNSARKRRRRRSGAERNGTERSEPAGRRRVYGSLHVQRDTMCALVPSFRQRRLHVHRGRRCRFFLDHDNPID